MLLLPLLDLDLCALPSFSPGRVSPKHEKLELRIRGT